ncbi:MAG: hypothetical protein GY778_21670 [bacterium]|nr:hypothetical protein [bacterium]
MYFKDRHEARPGFRLGHLICTALAALLSADQARGQRLFVSSPTSGLNRITDVGRIANNTSVSPLLANRGYQAAAVATTNARQRGANVGLTFPGPTLDTNRRIRNQYTAGIQANVRTGWLRQLAPGGAARYFDRRIYTPGRQQRRRMGPQPAGQLILQPELMLNAMGGLAPAFSGSFSSGGPRDRLSERDRVDQPRFSIDQPPPVERRSQADMLELRLDGMREEALENAWSYFRAGNFLRARAAFQNAEMLDRDDPEPRIGMFYSDISEQRYSQAAHGLIRIYRLDGDGDPFAVDYKLVERYESEQALRLGLQRLRQALRFRRTALMGAAEASRPRGGALLEGGDMLGMMAAASFAYWHSGLDDLQLEAIEYAERLQKLSRTNVHSQLARLLLQTPAAVGAGATLEE